MAYLLYDINCSLKPIDFEVEFNDTRKGVRMMFRLIRVHRACIKFGRGLS